jgi:hypothetical protein
VFKINFASVANQRNHKHDIQDCADRVANPDFTEYIVTKPTGGNKDSFFLLPSAEGLNYLIIRGQFFQVVRKKGQVGKNSQNENQRLDGGVK